MNDLLATEYRLTVLQVTEEIWQRALSEKEQRQEELARQLWQERRDSILRGDEIPCQTASAEGR